MKNFEVRTIEKNGISVTIAINYDLSIVSLVEGVGTGYQAKKWLFANRGLEYMNSWLKIIDAMKFAIEEGKKELEHQLAESSKFKIEKIEKVIKSKNKVSKVK